jgi:hypothetical protein
MDAASRRCHPEPIRFAQGKLREGSVALGVEMLRCAQHDNMDTRAASRRSHPERSEGSVALGVELLRGVYPERSNCAQHDRAILLLRHCRLRAFHLPSPQRMVIGNFLG